MTVQAVVPLESMRCDERGRLMAIDGVESSVHRLQEMGLREGARVRMIRPGSPCIVQVNDQRLSLRTGGEVLILVQLDAGVAE